MPKKVFKMGASTDVRRLPEICDWIIEGQRDLELYTLAGFIEPPQPWKEVFKDVPKMLDGHTGNFGLHGPIPPLASMDPDITEIVLRRLREALDVCAEINATHMVIHSPLMSLGAPFPLAFTQAMILNPAQDLLGKVAEMAQQAGCMVVVENIFDIRPDYLVSLVKSVNSDHMKVSIDTGHA
ncbi:MAG: TIM barrel protein, partial [Chloroflexi bacterium]|nr:TIM barrel protein [Chloroflexota bacterium]